MELSLDGKVIFMTGATSGLGRISALKAANEGAHLIILARNDQKGVDLINSLQKLHPDAKGRIEIVEGDLASFESIRRVCHYIRKMYPKIDMIINNAGVMNFERNVTIDGIEETLQVNLLSPILICRLLQDQISKEGEGRIIFTSSALHQGRINFFNLEFEKGFSGFKAYRQSKLGVILTTKVLAKELKQDNIFVYCQHPGIVRTDLDRSAGWFTRMVFKVMGKTAEQGAETLNYLIGSSNIYLNTGAYYANLQVTKTTQQSYDLVVGKNLIHRAEEYLQEFLKPENPYKAKPVN